MPGQIGADLVVRSGSLGIALTGLCRALRRTLYRPVGLGSTKCAMKFGTKCQAGFTLAEVLAALLFMAVVIPVAVDGLRVASRASVLGQRKAVAARIAESVLNEQVVASQGTL